MKNAARTGTDDLQVKRQDLVLVHLGREQGRVIGLRAHDRTGRPDAPAANIPSLGGTVRVGIQQLISSLDHCQVGIRADTHQLCHQLGLIDPADARLPHPQDRRNQIARTPQQRVGRDRKTVIQPAAQLAQERAVELEPRIVRQISTLLKDSLSAT